MPQQPKEATQATATANRDAAARYDLANRQDFADADHGFIAGFPDQKVRHADGTVMADLAQFGYLTDDAPPPDTVHPSLAMPIDILFGFAAVHVIGEKAAQAGQLKLHGDEAVLAAYAGAAGRWIQTVPGRGWFCYFRIYGPGQAAFDGSWRPSDFTPA